MSRAAEVAASANGGLALVHSHPRGRGWQGMSDDDVNAERKNAARVKAITGLPLLGMTLGTADGGWGARLWKKTAPGTYERQECETVRVVGPGLQMTYHPQLRPEPPFREELARTMSAWGDKTQADIARLRVGVVGLGSVGSIIAEALARMGVEELRLIDFDGVETVNLDRLLNARRVHAQERTPKVVAAAHALRESATARRFRVDPVEFSVVEHDGFRAALDCDVLFSCVDRPWPRYALNVAAYAHLVPVIDGGIVVTRTRTGKMRGADWRAHVAAPGRRCLECLGQYDPGAVQLEREGRLDDPRYISQLASDHPVKRNENVFAFSAGCAALELSQFISLVFAPGGIADIGPQLYHLSTGTLDHDEPTCESSCFYSGPFLATADRTIDPTGLHPVAAQARARRRGNHARLEAPSGQHRWMRAITRLVRRPGPAHTIQR